MEVWFIRHAKSSWGDLSLADKERPLNDRGHRDAPVMAEICKRLIEQPARLVSSPALRASTTAKYFASSIHNDSLSFEVENDLYHGQDNEITDIIQNTGNQHKSIILFSHNPDLEYWVSVLAKPFKGEIPTCGMIRCLTKEKNWASVNFNNLEYVEHYFPKEV